MRTALLRLGWLLCWTGAAAPAAGAELRPHDILVLDTGVRAVLRVDAASGDREVISSPEVGAGAFFAHATDLELAPDGALLVLDRNRYTVVRVDPASGDRSVLVPETRGRALGAMRGIARAPSGEYLIGCSGRRGGALYRLDPATGETRRVPWRPGPGRPQPRLANPLGLVFHGGRLYVADSRVGVLGIDPQAWEGRRLVPAGPREGEVREPYDVAVAADGSVFVADKAGRAVLRVPPDGGAASIVSGAGVGAGPAFASPSGLAIDAAGSLLLADRGVPAIFRVDPDSGERSVLASAAVGRGPLRTPRRLLVVPGRASRARAALWAGAGLLALVMIALALQRARRRG